jgi:hypothetical protein
LEIDAVTGQCTFDGTRIDQLTIAGALRAWLKDDLASHRIDPGNLHRATLIADLQFSKIDSKKRVTHDFHMDQNGRPIEEGDFHQLSIRCRSEISTGEKVYRSQYADVEEFPQDWPAA